MFGKVKSHVISICRVVRICFVFKYVETTSTTVLQLEIGTKLAVDSKSPFVSKVREIQLTEFRTDSITHWRILLQAPAEYERGEIIFLNVHFTLNKLSKTF